MKTALLLLLVAIASSACSAQEPIAPGEAYALAVERARASDHDGALIALRVALDADPEAYQRALLEPAFAHGFRDEPEVREAMHAAAVRHRIAHLILVPEGEPGERVVIEGQVVDPAGASVSGAVVRLFATDAEGRYHPSLPGEDRPRIFGTLVSGAGGRFVFETVRPGPYPDTRNPRHVHISVRTEDGRMRLAAPGYVVFDDDPLLFEPANSEPRGEALRIAMTPSDEARGTLVLPLR